MTGGYVSKLQRAPRTLTAPEQKALLRASGRYQDTFRDHVLFSIALGTALRESEIVALNVGDVAAKSNGRWRIRRQVKLKVFKRSNGKPSKRKKNQAPQEVFLPDGTTEKIRQFLKWKRGQGEDLTPGAPLLVTERPRGRRLSTRTLRHIFREWQELAEFDQYYTFHDLRHTSVTNIYKLTKDIRAAQRHARHARIETTTIYTHLSDDDLLAAVKDLPS